MAISVDGAADSATLAGRYRLTYPLLTDPGLKTALAYGVAMEGRDIAIPSLFVVDTTGDVVWRYVGTSIVDRPHSATIIDVLSGLDKR